MDRDRVHAVDGLRADWLGTGAHGGVSRHLIDSWIIDAPAMPADDYGLKARYLRALYREMKPSSRWTASDKFIIDQREQAEQWAIVDAEYHALRSAHDPPLEHILADVWIEERELKGQYHDLGSQAWRNADGSRVDYDR